MTIESSGDARVDAVLARLDGIESLQLADLVAVFAEAQADLAAVLEADAEPDWMGADAGPAASPA